MTILIIIFLCGAAYEITSVFWVFSTEQRKPLNAGFWSAIQAFVMITGIGESLHNPWAKASFIIGYGFGSWIAIFFSPKLFPASKG